MIFASTVFGYAAAASKFVLLSNNREKSDLKVNLHFVLNLIGVFTNPKSQIYFNGIL